MPPMWVGAAKRSVGNLGEDALVRFLAPARPDGARGVILGPGDDAAVVRPRGGERLIVTTDLLAEGVHFSRAWATPRDLGWKLGAVNASDVAAMGGRPLWALLSLALPPDLEASFVGGLRRGLRAAARAFDFALVGGDTCASGGGVFLSLTLVGAAGPRILRRRGARAGDLLFVTGDLGASSLGLTALARYGRTRVPRLLARCARRHLHPEPRLAFGAALARAALATSAMDVSDGLSRDLGRLCAASGVGAEVEERRLPIRPATAAAARTLGAEAGLAALHGGEEYELLFAARPASAARIAALAKRLGIPVTLVGRIVPAARGMTLVRAADGGRVRLEPRTWEHFSRR